VTDTKSAVYIKDSVSQSQRLRGPLSGQFKELPEKVRREHITDIKIGDYIAMAALVGTIGAFVIPLIQVPMLDYTVEGPFPPNRENTQQFVITISNVGVATAEQILVSLHSDNSKFLGFTSQPFLGGHVNDSLTDEVGKGLLDIDNLPSGSKTLITVTVSNPVSDEPEPELITYVRSGKVVASHQSYNMLVFYSILFAVYILFVVIFGTGAILPITAGNKRNYRRFAVVGIIISTGVIMGNMLLYLPYLSPDDLSYRINFYFGPVLVPVIILILCLIFAKLASEDDEKDAYWGSITYIIIAISLLSTITLYSYLPNIETNSIFHQLSYLGIAIGILGVILPIPGIFFVFWLKEKIQNSKTQS
jgi:hypothetical protein